MKKKVLTMTVLAACMMLVSCGRESGEQVIDTVRIMEDSGQAQPEGDASGAGEQPEAGNVTPEEGNSAEEKGAEDEQALKELAAAGGEPEDIETEETEILYPNDENTLEKGLEVTLGDAKLNDSPEEAQLDRALMEKSTENYDLSGEPSFCGIDEARILTCNLTVKNVNVEREDGLHMSEIMVAYADPATGKVSLLTCMPVYFSASSSKVGESDYYHYAIPKGESKDMTVAWSVPEEYEAENLYLGVCYDVREPQERQYFRLF